MAIAPLSDPIVAAVADLFCQDRWQPSHDDLSIQFRRAGLAGADPRRVHSMVGKRKRVRGVLLYAMDQNRLAGQRLVAYLIGAVKGAGGFRPTSEFYVGLETFENLREAVRTEGFDLDSDGNLRPLVLDNLHGKELDRALIAYVRRAQQGADDAPLVAGTAKDFLEAVARRVMARHGHDYATRNFAETLYEAFYLAGLEVPPESLVKAANEKLDHDARKQLHQCLYLAASAANRLRNQEGTGHGRPNEPTISERDAKSAIQVMGVVGELLLEADSPTRKAA